MAVDIILIILGALCLLAGLAGSVLPFPGPPLSFLGILLIHWTRMVDFTGRQLMIMGVLTVVVTIIDLIIPAWGVRKFGGTRLGMWGSVIGLVIGMFFGPWGIFIGAFVGGFIGELIGGQSTETATKAAFGSFIGFIGGALLKLVVCGIMIWYAIMVFFQ